MNVIGTTDPGEMKTRVDGMITPQTLLCIPSGEGIVTKLYVLSEYPGAVRREEGTVPRRTQEAIDFVRNVLCKAPGDVVLRVSNSLNTRALRQRPFCRSRDTGEDVGRILEYGSGQDKIELMRSVVPALRSDPSFFEALESNIAKMLLRTSSISFALQCGFAFGERLGLRVQSLRSSLVRKTRGPNVYTHS